MVETVKLAKPTRVEILTYGLELTCNSKVGWAFSLPRNKTCIGSTAICRKLCYGNGIRYQSKGQIAKRERNFRTVELLLKEGGPQLLAENLVLLIDQARPRDWLTAKVTGTSTVVPWSIRLQDLGDFFSIDYVKAWEIAAQKRPACAFWFYTRSFHDKDLLKALTELASLPNCQGWLSVDSENYSQAILAKCQSAAGVWKLALLQDKDIDAEVVPALLDCSVPGEVVNFPYHRSGHHVSPLRVAGLTVCPAVTGTYKLQSNNSLPKPCQICSFCLP